jgi:hypothetical protein
LIKPTRKDTWKVTLFVNGKNWEVWDTRTGGEVDSEQAAPYKPGGMGEPIAMGGSVTTANLVLSRMCRVERDWGHIQELINAAGKATVELQQAALDIDGNAYDANPLVWKGKLKRVTMPEVDSNSTDAAMIELEIVVDGIPTFAGASAAPAPTRPPGP